MPAVVYPLTERVWLIVRNEDASAAVTVARRVASSMGFKSAEYTLIETDNLTGRLVQVWSDISHEEAVKCLTRLTPSSD